MDVILYWGSVQQGFLCGKKIDKKVTAVFRSGNLKYLLKGLKQFAETNPRNKRIFPPLQQRALYIKISTFTR